jgi:hypothetical protein
MSTYGLLFSLILDDCPVEAKYSPFNPLLDGETRIGVARDPGFNVISL